MQNIFLLLKNHKPEKSTERFKTIIISAIVAIGIWFMVIYINDPSITITLKDIDAKIIGEDETVGSIAVGKRANLCFLDDEFNLMKLFVDGNTVKTERTE